MKVHLVTPVWGRAFTRAYLSLCVPNQLCAGNLPALIERTQATYKIYTRSKDAETILADPHFRRLSALVATEIVALDHLFAHGDASAPALLTMTTCHRAAVDAANIAGAALMFLPPDQVYSDGAFDRCARVAERGTRAVVVPGLRLSQEAFSTLASKADGGPAALYGGSTRTLLARSLPHLSPITRAMFIDACPFSDAPTHLYFRVGDEGFVIRALHLHVLFIDPVRRVPLRYGNFDTGYLLDACPSPDSYHIVSDSDEMVALELSPEAKQLGQNGNGPFDPHALARFFRQHGHRLHHAFLRTPIFMHTQDLSPRWREVARQSGVVVRHAVPLRARLQHGWWPG